MNFFSELRRQRWDDHRYYHHNRINQFLHFLSASCFLTSYVLIFFNPVAAVMVGWLLAMVLRQAGHFFFEPKSYDEVNNASHEYKESIKVGYNLYRKVILLSIWLLLPIVLLVRPDMFGLFAHHEPSQFVDNVAILWLITGVGALLFRTVHLVFLRGTTPALAWFTKILTDPFHDIMIYYKSPYYILKGEMYDEMTDWYDQSLVLDTK